MKKEKERTEEMQTSESKNLQTAWKFLLAFQLGSEMGRDSRTWESLKVAASWTTLFWPG